MGEYSNDESCKNGAKIYKVKVSLEEDEIASTNDMAFDGKVQNNSLANGDNSLSDSDEQLCTICLLPLENGDRIADLKCGHFYHADCLSEWILKKVRFVVR